MFSSSVQSRPGAWFLIMLGMLAFAGCAVLSRDAIMYHSFSYPVPSNIAPATVPETLMIYRFLVGPAVDTDYLMVTGPATKEEAVSAHRWSRSPADMIGDLIERDLAEARIFEKTVGQFSNSRYRYALGGKVLEMKGVRKGDKAAALIEAEVKLTDFGVPLGADKTILKKTYRIEDPSKDTSPAAIVEALNRAVREFSRELRQDIAAAVRGTGGPARQREQKPSPVALRVPASGGSAGRLCGAVPL